ncbi:FMN-binding negative transcriptional regulator [Jannaschia sp. M317]|uniref:FMN-binding negative transcriptional regulator n=1 Tax=Jannaschia sp. M317 TaxID=2867011 RepID=UPI0021A6515B|nr:FMN-binding negative transcriptional regulator [Jannaschia sp. M317]UWQ18244.1 FMN-binding negative transcriptional regulator [Jannaschia sp. M317]
MHPNPAFRQTPDATTLAFVRDRAFGVLAVNADEGPLISHVPFLLSEDATTADLHLVRSNPILRLLDAPAVIAVSGPDAYLSPDWYGVDDQVPTWNYVAAHLRGRLTRLPEETMRDMLDRQSAGFEHRLPKTPWTADKMTPEVLDRMMRQIVPCRLDITRIDATWKLGQNKPEDVRRRAAGQVAGGVGSETETLSALMLNPPLTKP